MPVRAETANAKSITGKSILTSTSRGSEFGGTARRSSAITTNPNPIPNPASQRQQHALRKKLPHQAAAPGAERRAHRYLSLARYAARQREIRQIRAADQQHHPDRRHQDPHRPAQVRADQNIGVGLHRDAPTFVRRRILRGDLRADAIHLRARLFSVTPGLSRANESANENRA